MPESGLLSQSSPLPPFSLFNTHSASPLIPLSKGLCPFYKYFTLSTQRPCTSLPILYALSLLRILHQARHVPGTGIKATFCELDTLSPPPESQEPAIRLLFWSTPAHTHRISRGLSFSTGSDTLGQSIGHPRDLPHPGLPANTTACGGGSGN